MVSHSSTQSQKLAENIEAVDHSDATTSNSKDAGFIQELKADAHVAGRDGGKGTGMLLCRHMDSTETYFTLLKAISYLSKLR